LTQKREEDSSHNNRNNDDDNKRLSGAEAFELNDHSVPKAGASLYMTSLKKNWKNSTKCSAVLSTILNLSNENKSSGGGKVVVFSQWTSFLDILEIGLANDGVSFTRLDGKLSQQQRQNVLQTFMSKDPRSPFVLLCSLKAGGVGLNLTNATHVILCDPWWNPAIEEQAIMRIHRIGQTQTVSVTRFIVENSVEEQMTLVQERKRTLCSGALTGSEARLTRLEDLKLLFQS
jgi:DNA repair protein RAD5